MKDVKKFDSVSGCIGAIDQQLEMIKFLFGKEHADVMDQVIAEINYGLSDINETEFNTAEEPPVTGYDDGEETETSPTFDANAKALAVGRGCILTINK